MVDMLTCQLQLKMKSKTECPLSMYRFFVTIKYLPILSTINLLLVTFIQILTAFYHLPISLVLYTHSLIDASKCAQVGLNYPLNYFLWKKFSLKMAILKILCFKRFMDSIHVVLETTLTEKKKPLGLVLPYLDSIFQKTTSTLKKSLKTSLIVITCK